MYSPLPAENDMASLNELEPHVYVASGMSPEIYDTTTGETITDMQYVQIDGWEACLVVVSTGTATDSDTTCTSSVAHSLFIDTDLELSGKLSSDVFEMVITVPSSDYSTTEGEVYVGDINFESVGWDNIGYIQPVFTTEITLNETLGLSLVFVLYGPSGNADTRLHPGQKNAVVTAY